MSGLVLDLLAQNLAFCCIDGHGEAALFALEDDLLCDNVDGKCAAVFAHMPRKMMWDELRRAQLRDGALVKVGLHDVGQLQIQELLARISMQVKCGFIDSKKIEPGPV